MSRKKRNFLKKSGYALAAFAAVMYPTSLSNEFNNKTRTVSVDTSAGSVRVDLHRFIACAETNARPDRGLNADEILFARAIFGDQIDVQDITLHQCFQKESFLAQAVLEKDIFFMDAENHSNNYANPKDFSNFTTYIHEITHLWQKQNNITAGNSEEYRYQLIKGKTFEMYGKDQQAAMVEDYAGIYLNEQNRPYWRPMPGNTPEKLRDMIEARFPQARLSRQHFERHGVLPGQQLNAPVKPDRVSVNFRIS